MWSGDTGEVTRAEVEAALVVIDAVPPVTVVDGNVLAYGNIASAARAASLLYQVTGDIRALNLAVRISDNILSLQNDVTSEKQVLEWRSRTSVV